MSLPPPCRIDLPCRDVGRQRDFYARILGLPGAAPGGAAQFSLGGMGLVLRPRGDALFPSGGGGGVLVAFTVPEAELDRWHRRMLMARAAVLEAPGPAGAPPRHLRIADPEGNVIELAASS